MDKKTKIIVAAVLILGCIASIVNIVRLSLDKKPRQAALNFKEEYEKVNGKTIKDDLKQRSLNIPDDNPYIEVSIDEIVNKINNKESFYLYVGDALCPWCRSGIEKMIEVAKKEGIKDIYYIQFWDDDHKELLRDVYDVEIKGKKVKYVKTQDAAPGYDVLLDKVKDYVQNYTINKDGKTYDVGVKRIYGGDHFKFVNGECSKYVSLRVDKLNNALDELTEDVLKQQDEIFTSLFKDENVCYGDENC